MVCAARKNAKRTEAADRSLIELGIGMAQMGPGHLSTSELAHQSRISGFSSPPQASKLGPFYRRVAPVAMCHVLLDVEEYLITGPRRPSIELGPVTLDSASDET